MRKNAIVNAMLNGLEEFQGNHPLVMTGAMIAGQLHPLGRLASTALTAANAANLVRRKQHISAGGYVASSMIPYTRWAQKNPMLSMVGSMGTQMGGDYLQQQYNAAHAEPRFEHAASYGGTRMSRPMNKKAALPLAAPLLAMGAKALPWLASAGKAALPMVGQAAAFTGVPMAMNAVANKLGPKQPQQPPMPPDVPKEAAFYYNAKAAMARLNYDGELNMYRPNPVAVSLAQRMGLVKRAGPFGHTPSPESPAGSPSSPSAGPFGYDPAREHLSQAEEKALIAKVLPGRKPEELPVGPDHFGGGRETGTSTRRMKDMLAHEAKGKLDTAITGEELGGAGLKGLAGGAAGGLAGLGIGALTGHPGTGAATGAGAGLGGTLGYQGGNLLALLLKSKGYGGASTGAMTDALRYGGAGLGGLAGGAAGYGLSHDKESSYQPRLLLSSLTNAVRSGGHRMLPESFPRRVG